MKIVVNGVERTVTDHTVGVVTAPRPLMWRVRAPYVAAKVWVREWLFWHRMNRAGRKWRDDNA